MNHITTTIVLVEGIDDAVFVRDVIFHWFGYKLKFHEYNQHQSDAKGAQILALKGKDKIKLLGPSILKPLIDERGITTTLVLFDADYPNADSKKQHKNRGGVSDRTAYIQEQANAVNISLQGIFLLPTGNQNGDLEVLLEQLVTVPTITKQWDMYEAAITPFSRPLEDSDRSLLSKKSKVFSYAEALTSFEEAGGRERNYLNKEHWNLDHTHEALTPLYDFLKPYFNKDTTP
jgi:hypothetical protein